MSLLPDAFSHEPVDGCPCRGCAAAFAEVARPLPRFMGFEVEVKSNVKEVHERFEAMWENLRKVRPPYPMQLMDLFERYFYSTIGWWARRRLLKEIKTEAKICLIERHSYRERI